MKIVDNINDSCFRCKNKTLKMFERSFQCIDENKQNADRFTMINIEESDRIGCEFHSSLAKEGCCG